MKVLVIGSGGREHAVVDRLADSPAVRKLYAAPGNGGIASQAELVPLDANNVEALAAFAHEQKIDLTFVGPEVPLGLGIVDAFRRLGLKIVGPDAAHARLETSKSYAKEFFKAYGIPTANFWSCASVQEALEAVERIPCPLVVKADGLAAGKGVIIAENHDQARTAVRDLMEARMLGDAGSRIVIEEYLAGEEASFHVLSDGRSFQPMVLAQDHKRRFDHDRGPNTGGMGAYSTDLILPQEEREAVLNLIIRPTLQHAPGYTGVLYAGLMRTPSGPKLLEYNARLGDPEAQVILPRLQTDLLEVLLDVVEGRLASRTLEWSRDAAVAVVLVEAGYPGRAETGKRILGIDEARRIEGVKVYCAGVRQEDGRLFTAGGRVINVVARGASLAEAVERAYFAAEMIEFDGKDYRRDIGRRGLDKQK